MFVFYVVDNSTPSNYTVVSRLMTAMGKVVGKMGVEVKEAYVYFIVLDLDAKDYPRVSLDKIREEFREVLSSYCTDCMVLIGYGLVPGLMIATNSSEQALKIYQLFTSEELYKKVSSIMVNFSRLIGSDIIEIIVLHFNKLGEMEYVGNTGNSTQGGGVITADANMGNMVDEEPNGDVVNTSSGNMYEQDGNDNIISVIVWGLMVLTIISVLLVIKRIVIGR